MDIQSKRGGKKLSDRRKPIYISDDPLLTAAESAAERGQALSTFWRDVAAGRVPPAYYVSPRCPRWRLSELRASIEACRASTKGAQRSPHSAALPPTARENV